MTKRITAILLTLSLALCLAACGTAASSSAPAQPKDYAQILKDARSDEDNEYLDIVAGTAEAGPSIVDAGEEWTEETIASTTDMMMQTLGLTVDMLDSYAFSMSLMNVRAYAVGIFLPAEGQAEAVSQALQAYVDAQRQAFQNYLPDQYEVAQDARLETAPTGEVVLVMCDGAADVQSAINDALAA